jgi:hypothetical protein
VTPGELPAAGRALCTSSRCSWGAVYRNCIWQFAQRSLVFYSSLEMSTSRPSTAKPTPSLARLVCMESLGLTRC